MKKSHLAYLLILATNAGFAQGSDKKDAAQWARFQRTQQESLSEDKQLVQRGSLRSPAVIRAEIARVRQEMYAETINVNAGRVAQQKKDQDIDKLEKETEDKIRKAIGEGREQEARDIANAYNAELRRYNDDKAAWEKRDAKLVKSIDTKGAHLVTLTRELESQPSSEEIRSEIAQLKAEIARDKADKAEAAEKEKKRQQNLNAEKGRLQREYAAETDKRKKSEIFTALNDLRVKDQRERSEWQNYDIAKLNKIGPAERRLAALEKLLNELEPSERQPSGAQAATVQPYISPTPPERLELPDASPPTAKSQSGTVPAQQQKPQVTPQPERPKVRTEQPATRQPRTRARPEKPATRQPRTRAAPQRQEEKESGEKKVDPAKKLLDFLK